MLIKTKLGQIQGKWNSLRLLWKGFYHCSYFNSLLTVFDDLSKNEVLSVFGHRFGDCGRQFCFGVLDIGHYRRQRLHGKIIQSLAFYVAFYVGGGIFWVMRYSSLRSSQILQGVTLVTKLGTTFLKVSIDKAILCRVR